MRGDAGHLCGLAPIQQQIVVIEYVVTVRSDLGLARTRLRFPKKGTCLAIYSYSVNAGCPLEETLADSFPWCDEWGAELKRLFAAYVVAKQPARAGARRRRANRGRRRRPIDLYLSCRDGTEYSRPSRSIRREQR